MNADDFQDVSRIVASSGVATAMRRVVDAVRAAIPQSMVGRAAARVRQQTAGVDAVTRVRLAGVLLLTAAVTQQMLLSLVPSLLRPALSGLLRVDLQLASVVLIGAAPWLVRAWPGSRLRWILRP